MKYKKFMIVPILVLLMFCFLPKETFADDIGDLTTNMKQVNDVDTTNSKIGKVINTGIKLIQIAGSGISVIMVTVLGIRYMLASSSEKAEIKKQAIPLVMGCVILFAAVNIAGIIATVGESLNPS